MIGFTPVNRTEVDFSADLSIRVDNGDRIQTLDSTSSPSALGRKRKQTQVFGPAVAEAKKVDRSKSKPVPRSGKTRKSTKISPEVKATKPAVLARTKKSFEGTPSLPLTDTFLEVVVPKSEIVTPSVQEHNISVQRSESRSNLPGPADNYQTACLQKKINHVTINASGKIQGRDALIPDSIQSLRSTASELGRFQDTLRVKWNDDDFPMDDDSIQEMMMLTEIKQATLNPVLHCHPDCSCLGDEQDRADFGWLEDSFCLDEQTIFKDGQDLHKVALNASNFVFPSASISNFVHSPSLSSTIHMVDGELNDIAAFSYANECFDDKDIDFELLEMTEPLCEKEMTSSPLTKPVTPGCSKQSSANASIERVESVPESPKFEIPWMISFDVEGSPIPFIRPSFPAVIRDRSPILGLSSRMVLRTCFRIGEALNAASAASRSQADAVIELYARVESSERELGGFKQKFYFSDLFTPGKPPFLAGTYGLWRGSQLWDLDSMVFLGEKGRGQLARAMGRIRREEQSQKWEMTILSVWLVDWDDVGMAKGIVLS
ncbi:hypothetical protein MMC07_002418 [Pseudocyphellaria aurata]|nr:hypothetical protein [Pseudocyphellaria aurata]